MKVVPIEYEVGHGIVLFFRALKAIGTNVHGWCALEFRMTKSPVCLSSIFGCKLSCTQAWIGWVIIEMRSCWMIGKKGTDTCFKPVRTNRVLIPGYRVF